MNTEVYTHPLPVTLFVLSFFQIGRPDITALVVGCHDMTAPASSDWVSSRTRGSCCVSHPDSHGEPDLLCVICQDSAERGDVPESVEPVDYVPVACTLALTRLTAVAQ